MIIENAYEGNLKHVSLQLPRNKHTVLTGVSGSGKSTLAIDVIYQECQRQYLEAMNFQGIQKPNVDRMYYTSPAIVIGQKVDANNTRSTVGTCSDIYTDLRMIYEKIGVRDCPNCHIPLAANDGKEEFVKHKHDYEVFMHCPHCHKRLKKLTRTDFSYNTKEGACPKCEGLKMMAQIVEGAVLHEALTLEEGAVDYWDGRYKEYQIQCFQQALSHYQRSTTIDQPVKDYDEVSKRLLCYGVEDELFKKMVHVQAPKTVQGGRFEGVYTTLWRRYAQSGKNNKTLQPYFTTSLCPACHGERLNEQSRQVEVMGKRLPELANQSLEELFAWIEQLNDVLSVTQKELIAPYLLDVHTKCKRILQVSLGYLSLDRQAMSLSGGESQRLRLAAAFDSGITGVLFILDEPTSGLHPQDTLHLMSLLADLRDLGNTLLVIEHDPEVMRKADHIIDMGVLAGANGGNICMSGTWERMIKNPATSMAHFMRKDHVKHVVRKAESYITIKNAVRHNLKHVDVQIPIGVLTTIAGVSGSGKSTLIFDVLAKPSNPEKEENKITGLSGFDRLIEVSQHTLPVMRRSIVASVMGIYDAIRTLFAQEPLAKQRNYKRQHFSFNMEGGRCDHCEGLGYMMSNMLFFADQKIGCPVCHGSQFKDEILEVTHRGYFIADILALSVEEARKVFPQRNICTTLDLLHEIGLGYITLGQSLTTLSKGECQRLKLAKEIVDHHDHHNLYMIDEPTCGMHPLDVDNFMYLMHRLVDQGDTVILIEHNEQVLLQSDWLIELGPQGGIHGGELLACGTPDALCVHQTSITGPYLVAYKQAISLRKDT